MPIDAKPRGVLSHISFANLFEVGITTPFLGAHIIEKHFLVMWVIQDLEWREFLAYNIVYCYIQYHQP
jgi:hypothetical protein